MARETTTLGAPDDTVALSNVDVIDTIRGHHAELAARLQEHTSAVLAAARHGECNTTREALHDWYRDELMAHILAEELALYNAAQELDSTRLLVCGMLGEHRALVGLIADLALARDPFDTALAAASARALFTVHVSKENDLLLPALDAAGIDLATLLAGMHEIVGSTAESADGCGCGCDHGAGEGPTASVTVQITERAPDRPDPDPTVAPSFQSDDEVDVRTLPHGQRHDIIFARLDALAAGGELVIVNDHDPKPLRYQTEALWPGRFSWTYREAGPRLWRVAITRAG